MAKNNLIDYKDLIRLQQKVADLGDAVLKQATINALQKSKDYANQKVEEAMNESIYNFKGKGRSSGRALKNAQLVSTIPVEEAGGFVYAYVGVSWAVAPEVTYLAYGTPHIAADFRLHNAIKVEGPIKKEVLRIQQEEFNKVLQEGMND